MWGVWYTPAGELLVTGSSPFGSVPIGSRAAGSSSAGSVPFRFPVRSSVRGLPVGVRECGREGPWVAMPDVRPPAI